MKNGHVIPWTLQVPLYIGDRYVGDYPDLDCKMLVDADGDLYGVELDAEKSGKSCVIEISKSDNHPLSRDIWNAAVTESQQRSLKASIAETITESLLDAAENRWTKLVQGVDF